MTNKEEQKNKGENLEPTICSSEVNQFSVKNAGGRPLKFKTVKELEDKCDEYFNTVNIKEWTITGLALHLDTYRSVLCDYEKLKERKEFSNTIKKAKLMVENSYEIDLKKSGRSGTIFALKNFNWSDKTEVDHTSKGEQIKGFNFIEPDDD